MHDIFPALLQFNFDDLDILTSFVNKYPSYPSVLTVKRELVSTQHTVG